MPHPKNPTPARIVPDGENWALPGTDIPAGTDPFQYAAGILAGILSLVAERDALNVEVERLRKVVGNLWKVIPAGTAEALRKPCGTPRTRTQMCGRSSILWSCPCQTPNLSNYLSELRNTAAPTVLSGNSKQQRNKGC
jgi:hypothetical protein